MVGMSTAARVSRLYMAIGLIACAVYFTLPRSAETQVLFVALAISTPVVGILTVRRVHSPARWRGACSPPASRSLPSAK